MKEKLSYAAALAVILLAAYLTKDVLIYDDNGQSFVVGHSILIVGVCIVLGTYVRRRGWIGW
jgi:hypothetical protein